MIKRRITFIIIFAIIFSILIPYDVFALGSDYKEQWTANMIKSRIEDNYTKGYLTNPLKLQGPINIAKDILMINRALGETEYSDLVIDKAGTIVENKIVDNLHITKSVGDGEVILKNVIVNGELLVEGGGRNSVKIENSTVSKLTTKKDDGKVRILIEGNTSVDLTSVRSSAILEQQKLTGQGFAEVTVEKGSSLSLATDKNATWSSSNKNIAEINSKGLVTAKKVGTANISVTSKYGNKIEICKVIVVEDADDYIDNTKNSKAIKILSIGNSFSEDATYFLYDIAKSAGVDIIVGNVYLSGCSLKTHWTNALNNNVAYTYYKWTSSTMTKLEKQTMQACILDEKWDFITFQQASGDSGIYSTYQPYLNNLVGYVKSLSTNVKFALNMTWAYAEDSTNVSFVNYNNDQRIMYESIINSYKQAAWENNDINIVIPCATAIQNARTNPELRAVGDELTLDGYHLNGGIGRYIAALTYFETLIVNNSDMEKDLISDVTYIPDVDDSTEQLANLAKIAVKKAIENPYMITKID